MREFSASNFPLKSDFTPEELRNIELNKRVRVRFEREAEQKRTELGRVLSMNELKEIRARLLAEEA